MTEQPLDLRSGFRVLRRRRRLVGVMGLLGLVGGIGYGVMHPPTPTAVALVLLPPGATTDTGSPARDMATQAAIVTGTGVLGAAARSVSPEATWSSLQAHVRARGISESVLAVTAKEPQAVAAEKLANAVASAYVAYVTGAASTTSGAALAGLESQSNQLTQQITGLQSEINQAQNRLASEGATSPAGQADTTLIGALRIEQTGLSAQLTNLGNSIKSANNGQSATANGTQMLQPATSVAPESKFHLPILGLIGLCAGLILGAVIALYLGRRDHRLRRRDELSSALGVQVLASIGTPRNTTTQDWNQTLTRYQPEPIDEWNLRQLLGRLGVHEPGDSVAVEVVSFANDQAALAAGPQLAAFAASKGIATALVPDEDAALTNIRAAGATIMREPRPGDTLTIESRDRFRMNGKGIFAVGLKTVETARPTLSTETTASSVVVAVSSGFATADELARLALAADDARYRVEGLVVVNPEPGDVTIGVNGATASTSGEGPGAANGATGGKALAAVGYDAYRGQHAPRTERRA